jgi:hypothetical protein
LTPGALAARIRNWQGSCDSFPKSKGLTLIAASLDHFGARNETQASFWECTPAREALQTKTLIADISRIVRILDSDIAAEEEHARVYDRSQVEYPMLARTMATRRDNLLNTIRALQQRLAKLDQPELVAELA